MTTLWTFPDGSKLEVGRGKFDDNAIFLTRPSAAPYKPPDAEYFTTLQRLADAKGSDIVYADYVEIYNFTGSVIDETVFPRIAAIAGQYGDAALEAEIAFSTLYAAMVAEERKKNTKLGRRIKRLGVHQLLIEKFDIRTAVNFSRGLLWPEIAAECERRGF